MFIEDNIFYKVLERCPDLFGEWEKSNGSFHNKVNGNIIRANGHIEHDLVYRKSESHTSALDISDIQSLFR